MDKEEFRAAASLAAVFSVRLLGLFMIYPVFADYARHLSGATPYLIGLALGIYGLSQALLQIPFGMLSDKFGRKTLIVLGLVIFGAGSAVAALSWAAAISSFSASSSLPSQASFAARPRHCPSC